MKEIYKLVADVLINYERMCQGYPFAVLTRDMGLAFEEFDKEFDYAEFKWYIAKRDERKNETT